MNPITQGLLLGYSGQQLLNFLLKIVPGIAPRVNQARSAGHSVEQILDFVSKTMGGKNYDKSLTPNEIFKKQNLEKEEVTKELLKKAALASAAGISGLAAMGMQGSQGQQSSGAIMPSQILPPLPSGPRGLPNPPQQLQLPNTQQISPSPQPGPNPSPVQPTQPTQPGTQPISPTPPPQAPVAPVQPTISSSQILQNIGQLQRATNLLKAGNPPETVAAAINSLMKGDERKTFGEMLKSGQTKPLIEMVKDLQQEIQQAQPAPQPMQPQPEAIQEQPIVPDQEQPLLPEEVIPVQEEPQPESEPEKPIEKKSIVATPHGVGEVKAISGDQAIVEIDGKAKKVPLDELEGEPEEVRNSTIDFDLNTIPEDLRSAPLNEVYTPADRRHVTVKYNQGLKPVRYIYYRKDGKPVPEEFIGKIREGVQLPITSGMNFWGAWDADKADSRGAANYEELVRNSQEEGKPNDPTKHYWFAKEEAIYEHPYMEKLGKEELRKREKEFNDREKERKRQAKPPKEKKPKKPRP